MSSSKKNKKVQKKNTSKVARKRVICIVLACISLIGTISVGIIAYDPDNSPTSTSTPSAETWSYGDTDDVFEEAYKRFNTLIVDAGSITSYKDFTPEGIETLETMCQHLSDDAKSIQATLTEKAPPKEYEDVWNDFATCMGEISNLFLSYDPENTGDEISAWLSVAANEFEVLSNEALGLAIDMIEINATITVVTDDFFLNIYNSEYQTIAEYKVTLTGKISNAGNEIISASFEHISGDECKTDYEIAENVVSVSITHPIEGRLLRILTLSEDATFSVSY